MTPYAYLSKYRKLTIPLVGGGTVSGVDVHEYRNAEDVFHKNNNDADNTNDVNLMPADLDAGPGWHHGWGPLRNKIGRHGKKIGANLYSLQFPLPTKQNPKPIPTSMQTVNTGQLASVYFGKGTPENIRDALRLAEAFALVQGNTAAMQKYCDDNIGLDCNGYVGNYLKQEGCTLVGPSTPAYAYAFVKEQYRIKTLDEVKYQSVLVWKNTGHVAIVDYRYSKTFASDGKTEVALCNVCESTGARAIPGDIHTDGLNFTMYEIYPPKTGKVFRVKRGIGGSALNEVYIGNLI